MDDYIRRAYFMWTGYDLRQLPDHIQQAFANLPPDPEWHDFSGEFSAQDHVAIQDRHEGLGIPYGEGHHDFSADSDANHGIDVVLEMMDRGLLPPDHHAGKILVAPPTMLSSGRFAKRNLN